MTQQAGDDSWANSVEWGRDIFKTRTPPPERAEMIVESVTRRTIEVICCPRCTSTRVGKRTGYGDEAIAYWQCRDCHETWKEFAGVGGQRARIP